MHSNSTDPYTPDDPQSLECDLDVTRLQPWLCEQVPEFSGLRSIAKFPGGQSNPTYRLYDGRRQYVLRRKPFGVLLPSAHAVEREFLVISTLHPLGFPVARPIALCEDLAVIGAPFYVMEMVEGATYWDGSLPELSTSERRGIYRQLVDVLADLHSFAPIAIGLGDYGPAGNYFERQTRRWTKQYRASQTDLLPEVEHLIQWLPATLPAQDRVAVIHGDYRIDNLIYGLSEPRVLAVLDWELSTLGDPLADFAYLATHWVMQRETGRATLGGLDFGSLGIPDLEEICAHYCARTGRAQLPDLNWYFAYNLFRLVGIAQGVKKRLIDGNASSANAATVAARIAPMAAQAWEFARRAGA